MSHPSHDDADVLFAPEPIVILGPPSDRKRGLHEHRTKIKRRLAHLLAVGVAAAGLSVIAATPAHASGCSTPPCGQVVNRTDRAIDTRWNNSDGIGWRYGWVNAGHKMGGYYHDGPDIDQLRIPAYTCFDISGWPPGQRGGSGGRWFAFGSHQTAVVTRAYGCWPGATGPADHCARGSLSGPMWLGSGASTRMSTPPVRSSGPV